MGSLRAKVAIAQRAGIMGEKEAGPFPAHPLMDNIIVTGLVGLGCFMLGWFTHTWIAARRAERTEEAAPIASRWKCNGCGRVKALPPELDNRVMVCNNCNVRLVRQGNEATG
jgi:hypothetical protein